MAACCSLGFSCSSCLGPALPERDDRRNEQGGKREQQQRHEAIIGDLEHAQVIPFVIGLLCLERTNEPGACVYVLRHRRAVSPGITVSLCAARFGHPAPASHAAAKVLSSQGWWRAAPDVCVVN